MYSGRRLGGTGEKAKSQRSMGVLFLFSRELGSNWKQQWGVGYMKKNTQLYTAGQS